MSAVENISVGDEVVEDEELTIEDFIAANESVSLKDFDPKCGQCKEFKGLEYMYPRHTASSACESGKRTHCTCDFCF